MRFWSGVPWRQASLAIVLLLGGRAVCAESPGACVIRPEEPASAEIFADHAGRRFFFCCESCRRDFLSDPSRFDGKLVPQASTASVDLRDGAGLDQWSGRDDAFANTWMGRVGQAGIFLHTIAKWLTEQFHLHDPASCGLAFLAVVFILAVLVAWGRQIYGGRALRPTRSVAFAVTLLLIPCFFADRLRHRLADTTFQLEESESQLALAQEKNRDMQDRDMIHYATLMNFGNPPRPRPSDREPSLRKTYYRGNDERSADMPHGGNYRTVTFEIWIEDADGQAIQAGADISSRDGEVPQLFLIIRFVRSPDTSSGYFTDQYMKRMYVTMQSGDFLGRDEPVPDRVAWQSIRPDVEWRASYPLPKGTLVWRRTENELEPQLHRQIDPDQPFGRGGVVYLCEDRFDRDRMIGGRFHYAIEYDLQTKRGVVQPNSDLWMQATYRGRNFARLQIEDDEWLSSQPIPER